MPVMYKTYHKEILAMYYAKYPNKRVYEYANWMGNKSKIEWRAQKGLGFGVLKQEEVDAETE